MSKCGFCGSHFLNKTLGLESSQNFNFFHLFYIFTISEKNSKFSHMIFLDNRPQKIFMFKSGFSTFFSLKDRFPGPVRLLYICVRASRAFDLISLSLKSESVCTLNSENGEASLDCRGGNSGSPSFDPNQHHVDDMAGISA